MKKNLLKCCVALAALLALVLSGCQINMEPVSEFFFGKRPLVNSDWETRPAETTEPATLPPETTEPEPTETEPPTEPPKKYRVDAWDGLNVRSGPSTGNAILGSLINGEVVIPLKWENGWAYIEGPLVGWCSGEFLVEVK